MAIEFPASLKLTRDTAGEDRLLERTREWLGAEDATRTAGLHASDMLDLRQAYWKRVAPLPLTERQVPMFMVGKVLHAFVLGAVGGKVLDWKSDVGSTTDPELGIEYSPDAVINGIVREFKTSRSFVAPTGLADVDHYVEQLLIYMAATKTTKGQVWVLYLNLRDKKGKTSPSFRCYNIRISEEDLVLLREQIKALGTALTLALETSDPSALPVCREWKCGARNCEWYQQCQPPGRFGEKRWDKD